MNAKITLERRYLKKNDRGEVTESPRDLFNRVAKNIAEVDGDVYGKGKAHVATLTKQFQNIMEEKKFLPNSPTLMNAGRRLQQLSACFVLPIEDSMESIFETLQHMALVQKTGGGTGFCFDHLRPAGDRVKSTSGVASGPVSFLKVYDAGTNAIKQGGTRRGANMGTLRYDHPDILEFIQCKTTEKDITNFNISVTVSDEFMEKATGINPDPMYDLINPRTKKPYIDPKTGETKQLNAKEVLNLIAKLTWQNGDPGLIFIDRMNKSNPTPHIGKYEATNPCVSGDTLVLTADGPRQVTDLVGKDSVLIVNGKPFHTTKEGFFSTGVKPLLQISTKEGFSMRVTAEHPVMAKSKGWVKAGELKVGDKIALHNHRTFASWNGFGSKDEGYLIGMLSHNGQPRGLAAIPETAVTLGMDLVNRKFTREFETKTSSDFIKGFLCGILDTYASLSCNRKMQLIRIRLPGSKDDLEMFQRMFLRFGINSTVAGKDTEKELQITDDNIKVFIEKIGFADSAKRGRLARVLVDLVDHLDEDDFTVTIDTVTQAEVEEVYDVQVPGINAFDANGFVVHNCGEQPLLPYEACCLGSINLSLVVGKNKNILWDDLRKTVHIAVHFLDNVVDATEYVIPQIEEIHKGKTRKIGLGVMGWHDMLVKLGLPYDSEEALSLASRLMKFINNEARMKSIELAKERGTFPSFAGSTYDTGKESDSIRNATRTTIAPTGTISIIAGASSGIEPYFSIAFTRKNVLGGMDLTEVNPLFVEIAKEKGFYSEELIEKISETGSVQNVPQVPDDVKRLFKISLEIEPAWHVKHQAAFQQHTDNAVSKTINMNNKATVEDIEGAYALAWESGCKGTTVYRDGSKTVQAMDSGIKQATQEKPVEITPLNRPEKLSGVTVRKETPMGNLFVTLNELDGAPFEIFAQIGKAGSDILAFTEALARLVSLALRCGIDAGQIISQLEGIGGGRSVGFGANRVLSVPDAIGKALQELLRVESNSNNNLQICPECGQATLIFIEGCNVCQSCGFSQC